MSGPDKIRTASTECAEKPTKSNVLPGFGDGGDAARHPPAAPPRLFFTADELAAYGQLMHALYGPGGPGAAA